MNPATGIFGGTFDPVHFGHLRAASEVNELLDIDDFRLLPAGTPPHRSNTYANGEHRLAMLRLAVTDCPDLVVDEREIHRQGASFMADTLLEIRAASGDRPLLLIVGQDAANKLDEWHRWRDLLELAHLVIMTRPDAEHDYSSELGKCLGSRTVENIKPLFEQPAGLVRYLNVTQLAISSTDIRGRILGGLSPRFLLPDRVLAYVKLHRLYQAEETGGERR